MRNSKAAKPQGEGGIIWYGTTTVVHSVGQLNKMAYTVNIAKVYIACHYCLKPCKTVCMVFSDNYKSHGGSLFGTGIKLDSNISSAKSEPSWLPYMMAKYLSLNQLAVYTL